MEQNNVNDFVTGWKLISLSAAISAACLLIFLDMSILATAIPRITAEFDSLADIGWYGSAYNLACASLQPLSGKFYKYFTTKWTFLAFLFTFELGSLICAIASSSKIFIVGRAVAGLGSSGIQNGSFAIVATAAPLERRPFLIGIIMGVYQLGLVGGPLIGGALSQFTTWRWCFYINLLIGAITTILVLLAHNPERVEKPRSKISNFDLPGLVIFALFAIMLLLGLEWGGSRYPWKSAIIIGLLCGGVGMLIPFFIWEHYVGENAIIPLQTIRKRHL